MFDYTRKDMVNAFRGVGLESGDLVLCYVSLGMLGLGQGVDSQESMNAFFLDCLREVVGDEGSIFIPTYTYSLCNGELFDSASTPSAVGPFTEYFRNQPGVIRSEDPILSVCGIGPHAKEVFQDLPATSYGRDCVYDRLANRGAKICTVGLRLNWATFRHYIEEMCNVPFRYRKVFSGHVLRNGKDELVEWIYSVRLWGNNAMPDGVRLAEMAVEDGICNRAPLGRNEVFSIGADVYVKYAKERLKDDPWLPAVGPAVDPIKLEEQRVPTTKYDVEISSDQPLEGIAQALSPLPREVMSDAYNQSLDVLKTAFGLSVQSYPSGTEGVDCIVPEKWTCLNATLSDEQGEVLFSLDQSPLRVASYSHSFSGTIPVGELRDHCISRNVQPGHIPYCSSLPDMKWGFCCSLDEMNLLVGGEFFVNIQSEFSYGNLNIGELYLQGQDDECITIVTFLDGPCQFDNGLSGVLVGCLAMLELQSLKMERSVRLLVLPRRYGLSVWLRQNEEKARKIVGLLFLDRLASGQARVVQPGRDDHFSTIFPDGDLTMEKMVKDNDYPTYGFPSIEVAGSTSGERIMSSGDVFSDEGFANMHNAVRLITGLFI